MAGNIINNLITDYITIKEKEVEHPLQAIILNKKSKSFVI